MSDPNRIDTAALRLIERDFERVLQEISNDKHLNDFKRNYTGLFDSLKNSHQKERGLMKKCQELNDTIAENAGKIKAVLQVAQDDSQTIVKLKGQLAEVKNCLVLQKERDDASRKQIENLTKTWKNLEQITKQNQEFSSGRLAEYQKLLDEKETLGKERGEFQSEVEALEKEHKELKEKFEKDNLAFDKKQTEFKKLDKMDLETELQLKKNEDRMKGNKIEIEQLTLQKKNMQSVVNEERSQLTKMEKNFQNILKGVEKNLTLKSDWETKREKVELNQLENDKKMKTVKATNAKLITQQEQLDQKLKTQILRHAQLTAKDAQDHKKKNLLSLEIQKLTDEVESVKKHKSLLQNQFTDFSQRIDNFKKEGKIDENTLEFLHNNYRKIMGKYEDMVMSDEEKIFEIRKLIMDNKNLLKNTEPLENEIEEQKKKLHISRLEEVKLLKDINGMNKKFSKINEELLLKENLIAEFQRKISEYEQQLKQQQSMYETIRNDRNSYSKSLAETQDEIAEIKQKLKITNDRIKQIKEEYELKEKLIFEEVGRFKDLMKKFKNIEKKNIALKKNKENLDKLAKNMTNQLNKYKAVRKEYVESIDNIQGKYSKVIIERDLLITKLIQKNDEIALINERLTVQENTMKEGLIDDTKNTNEFNFLQTLVKDLGRELKINTSKIIKVLKYQKDITELNEKLRLEKIKVKELSKKLENPKNKERWRHVGEIDYDIYELMQKIQDIQKKLIKKTEEIITTELDVSAQEQTIDNIKNILQQQPDSKEAQKFSILQKSIRSKTRKLKVVL